MHIKKFVRGLEKNNLLTKWINDFQKQCNFIKHIFNIWKFNNLLVEGGKDACVCMHTHMQTHKYTLKWSGPFSLLIYSVFTDLLSIYGKLEYVLSSIGSNVYKPYREIVIFYLVLKCFLFSCFSFFLCVCVCIFF